MSNHTASLINSSVGQDIKSNLLAKESNPPSTESDPPQESELPAEKSLASQKGNHRPNKKSELPAKKIVCHGVEML
ncbi:hypothetical protein P9112_010144 [Eukaryota sp. TZLM1-RC]